MEFMKKHMRMGGWLVINILLLLIIWYIAPQQFGVMAYKLSLVSIGGYVAYHLDRSLFAKAPSVGNDQPRDTVFAARLVARALIFVGVVLGLSLGV